MGARTNSKGAQPGRTKAYVTDVEFYTPWWITGKTLIIIAFNKKQVRELALRWAEENRPNSFDTPRIRVIIRRYERLDVSNVIYEDSCSEN